MGDLHVFDPKLRIWNNITSANAPSGRQFHGFAADTSYGLGRLFVMGGINALSKFYVMQQRNDAIQVSFECILRRYPE